MSLEDDVRAAVAEVDDPCSVSAGCTLNLVEMGLLRSVRVVDGAAELVLGLTSPTCDFAPMLAVAVQERVERIAGVRSVDVTVKPDPEWSPASMSTGAQYRMQLAARTRAERIGAQR